MKPMYWRRNKDWNVRPKDLELLCILIRVQYCHMLSPLLIQYWPRQRQIILILVLTSFLDLTRKVNNSENNTDGGMSLRIPYF